MSIGVWGHKGQPSVSVTLIDSQREQSAKGKKEHEVENGHQSGNGPFPPWDPSLLNDTSNQILTENRLSLEKCI